MVAKETWLPVVGYEDLYQVSDLGRVRSILFRNRNGATPRILFMRFTTGNRGHLKVDLSKDGRSKKHFVHRLVLEAFEGPCPLGFQAAHLDGHPAHNGLPNLMWATPRENHGHMRGHGTMPDGEKNGNARLTDTRVLEIRGLHEAGVSQAEIGRRLNVHFATVHRVVRRKAWAHVS